MSAMFSHAVRMQVVASNVVRATQAPAKRDPKLRVPTAEELQRIIEAAKNTRWEIPVLLSATTGARRGEVLGLRWANVDLDRGRARIDEALQRQSGRLVYLPPKTDRGKRSVPLTTDVMARLRTHRTDQAKRLLALGVRQTNETPVCDRGDGEPIDPSTYGHAFIRIARDSGFAGVRLHDLRHAVATMLAERRNAPELTSKMLGHASVGFTLTTYTHPTDDEMDGVAKLLDQALGG
jgi:integrase